MGLVWPELFEFGESVIWVKAREMDTQAGCMVVERA